MIAEVATVEHIGGVFIYIGICTFVLLVFLAVCITEAKREILKAIELNRAKEERLEVLEEMVKPFKPVE